MVVNCWFLVLWNGGVTGYFQSTRGLRQGDPLLPYLFIIVEEVVSRNLSKLGEKYRIGVYVTHRGYPPITHSLYADDTIIFTRESKQVLEKVMTIIRRYEKCSGQLVNKAKSWFFTSAKAFHNKIQIITSTMGFLHKPLPFTYFSIPIGKGHVKAEAFDGVVQKVVAKILGWKGKVISAGGVWRRDQVRVFLEEEVLSSIQGSDVKVSNSQDKIVLLPEVKGDFSIKLAWSFYRTAHPTVD
ncbi:PREDICTED: uncharacterized protein LOC104607431 [Nelumbo nucifera]|uniref:Uncharacterized protein LOC104607431 n=1 Tax=Nelumbo nucifera TaxID=4432 RepID=A0A1U8ATK2_NELNU|nr:PREDICTED: uncharacterized protein LOC104607431 [Nelumbo nucifera]